MVHAAVPVRAFKNTVATPGQERMRDDVRSSRSWFDRLTTNDAQTVRPEPVEGRLPWFWNFLHTL